MLIRVVERRESSFEALIVSLQLSAVKLIFSFNGRYCFSPQHNGVKPHCVNHMVIDVTMVMPCHMLTLLHSYTVHVCQNVYHAWDDVCMGTAFDCMCDILKVTASLFCYASFLFSFYDF